MDDIMDLLGPDLSQVPSSKSPWDDLPPMQEPVVTDTTNQADLWLPTNVAMHYREYDRTGPAVDSLMEKIKRDGILTPIQISTNGSVAVVHEGNHRLQVADRLGIGRIPCKITYDLPIISNGGMVAPLESVLENWVSMNKDRMRSFRGSRVAGTEFAPGPVYRGINTDMLTHEELEEIEAWAESNSFSLTDYRLAEPNYDLIYRIVDRFERSGLGRHWSKDYDVSRDFAEQQGDNIALIFIGDWDGQGLDEREFHRGWDGVSRPSNLEHEKEVTLLPGTNVTLVGLDVIMPTGFTSNIPVPTIQVTSQRKRKEAFDWGKSPWAEKDYLNPSYAEYGPMTLYRGYSFEANAGVKDELLERIKGGESINAVFEDALTEMRYSVMQLGEAVGRYWTTDKDYALKLALVDSPSDDHVGLYIQAHWEGGDHDIDFGVSDRTNYWGNESEVRLFSGTQLKGMEVGIYINGRWYVGKGSRDFVAEVRSVAGTEWQPGPVYRGLNTDTLTHEKTASPQTLYRGIPLSPDKATSDRIQRSFEAGDFYTVGEEILRIVDRDTGAGTSWTTRDGVAVRFALSNDSWIPYGNFAVVLEGHWAGGNIDHSRDRDDDDPDRYEEFEDEVRLFAGDKVTVTKISVRAGTRAQDAESYMESLKWTTWDVHRTLTALNEKSVEKRKTTSQRYAERLAKYRR